MEGHATCCDSRHDSRTVKSELAKHHPVQDRWRTAVCIGLGVTRDGLREVLGLWIAENEGVKFWLR